MLADVLKRKGSIACVECAVEMRRRDILFDLLSALARNQKIWNLDLCQVVLPVLEHLLDSKEEEPRSDSSKKFLSGPGNEPVIVLFIVYFLSSDLYH